MRWGDINPILLFISFDTTNSFFSSKSHNHRIFAYSFENIYATSSSTCRSSILRQTGAFTQQALHAKRNRKGANGRNGGDNSDNWYEDVGDNATPDAVFWEEMERQRMINQLGNGGDNSMSSSASASASAFFDASPSIASTYSGTGPSMPTGMSSATTMGTAGGGGGAAAAAASSSFSDPTRNMLKSPTPTLEQQKSAEATLSEYTMYQVENNWLDERLQAYFDQMETMDLEEDNEMTIEEETRRLEEQLEALPDGGGSRNKLSYEDIDEYGEIDDGIASKGDTALSEPWDTWGEETNVQDLDRVNTIKVPEPARDSEFYMDWDDVDNDNAYATDSFLEEAEFNNRMRNCRISSNRLYKAYRSDKAKEFFKREPNAREGFDRVWVSAIDNACFKSLFGNIRNYGVEFADNFGDFVDGCPEDGLYTIEDVASYKARKVYEVTGLPCIASRTSFEVEPIPPESLTGSGPGASAMPQNSKASPATNVNNPKVMSGYKFNDIGNHVDYTIAALQPLSEPTRVTRFTSCLCFYDGEMEIFEYGVCDVDMVFCHSRRTYIPMAQAIHNMIETLKWTLGLEFQKWLKVQRNDAALANGGTIIGPASLKLRDRVLRDGRVLPNDIIDVSAFMDSQVDVNLMDACAKELAERFMRSKPTKILTVATTGLVIALPLAKYLQVPVVYARKERNVVMADTFQAGFASKTVGKNRELLVSKNHLSSEDRILIIDDFLSSGASQEALLRIISEAEATAVGVGVLLEKSYESGRQSLSGFNIPIHSLCRVASVGEGTIQLVEEDGFEQK